MPRKQKQNCANCNKFYIGVGRFYCSPKCQYEALKGDIRLKYWLGRNRSQETKEKIKKNNARYWLGKNGNQQKENHWHWKGGITPKRVTERNVPEYSQWRKAIFVRDNYTCQICKRKKEVSGKLTADHIKPFSIYPALRFDLNNGRTLCRECHIKTDTWGGKMQKFFRKQKTVIEII